MTPAADQPLELTCFLHPSWRPVIRPAGVRREWMERAPEAFPHRCLPLNIANCHGWEIATPIAVEAVWNGGGRPEDVTVSVGAGADPLAVPVGLFGQGVLTFHVPGLFRTPPGWDLWVGGPPNQPKDALAPLTGIVETDWAPFTFTMNWQFTRAGWPVRFAAGEAVAFVFPIQRGSVERFVPRFADLAADPELERGFAEWSRERDRFHAQLAARLPSDPADKWQKHYYRGVDVAGCPHVDDHRTKLRVARFGSAVEAS